METRIRRSCLSANTKGSGAEKRVPLALLLVAMLLLGPVAWFGDVSDQAEATILPLSVYGTVADTGGNPISGANVTATVLYVNGSARATRDCVSESDGSYFIYSDFDPLEWDVGSRIEVVAAFGGDYGLNSTVVTADAGEYGILSVDVTFPLKVADIVLSLSQGWNLVSIPLVNHGYWASTLPGLINGDSVFGWDPATKRYNQSFVVGLTPRSYDFPLVASTGYWICANAPRTLELKGDVQPTTQIRDITVPSTGGWAIVGFSTLRADLWASNISYQMWSSTGNITTVSSYNPATKNYTTYIRGVASTNFLLVPGKGYWCYCTASGVLSYNP